MKGFGAHVRTRHCGSHNLPLRIIVGQKVSPTARAGQHCHMLLAGHGISFQPRDWAPSIRDLWITLLGRQATDEHGVLRFHAGPPGLMSQKLAEGGASSSFCSQQGNLFPPERQQFLY